MERPNTCPRCGVQLPGGTPPESCPRCLLELGMSLTDDEGAEVVFTGYGAGRPTPPTPEELGSDFPQLEILGLLGQGGMGAVYEARQKELDRKVALKILTVHEDSRGAFEERFVREARALASLGHPGIVAVHDFGRAGERYFLLMEFVEGKNLRQVVREGLLESSAALGLVSQICAALQYAHEEGVVHRDIKPENILLDAKGRVKIADFGLAKLLGLAPEAGQLTGTAQAMGTPHYMAPEQIERPQEVDHRADIYSLGVVFYELLTGELPIGRFLAPSSKIQVDVRVDDVVLRSLEKEPKRRYQRASEVQTDVDHITATPGKGARRRRRHHAAAAAAAVAGGGAAPRGRWHPRHPAAWLLLGFLGVAVSLFAVATTLRMAEQGSNGGPLGYALPVLFVGTLIAAGSASLLGFLGLMYGGHAPEPRPAVAGEPRRRGAGFWVAIILALAAVPVTLGVLLLVGALFLGATRGRPMPVALETSAGPAPLAQSVIGRTTDDPIHTETCDVIEDLRVVYSSYRDRLTRYASLAEVEPLSDHVQHHLAHAILLSGGESAQKTAALLALLENQEPAPGLGRRVEQGLGLIEDPADRARIRAALGALEPEPSELPRGVEVPDGGDLPDEEPEEPEEAEAPPDGTVHTARCGRIEVAAALEPGTPRQIGLTEIAREGDLDDHEMEHLVDRILEGGLTSRGADTLTEALQKNAATAELRARIQPLTEAPFFNEALLVPRFADAKRALLSGALRDAELRDRAARQRAQAAASETDGAAH